MLRHVGQLVRQEGELAAFGKRGAHADHAHAGEVIPKVVDIDPFHPVALWVDFCRQSGAGCAAGPDTASLRDAAGGKKRPARAGGAHRPGGPMCPMKWVTSLSG